MADFEFGSKSAAELAGDVDFAMTNYSATTSNAIVIQSSDSVFAQARSGDESGSPTVVSASGNTQIDIGTYNDSGTYRVLRANLLFRIPENLVQLSGVPKLKIYPFTTDMTASIVVASHAGSTSGVAAGANNPMWETNASPATWGQLSFTNVQYGSSAALYATATGPLTKDAYNTITLNQLAAYHCLTIGSDTRFLLCSFMNAAYDYADSAPGSSVSTTYGDSYTQIRGQNHANEPLLVLPGPWFKNAHGETTQKYDGDYVIKAHDPNLNQFPKRVAQTPFGLNIKGPISLRGTDNAYKTTRK